MTHLFIHGDVGVYPAFRHLALFLHILGQTQQNAHAELIVQEAALDVAVPGDAAPGIEADDIPYLDAQLPGLFGGSGLFVQHHFGVVKGTQGGGIVAVYMDGGVAQLEGAFIAAAVPGEHGHVLRFGVIGVHAAQRRDPQASAALYFRYHGPQGIRVGFQHQPVLNILSAKIHQYPALDGAPGLIAQGCKGVLHIGRRLLRIPGRAGDVQKFQCLFYGKFRIFLVHMILRYIYCV